MDKRVILPTGKPPSLSQDQNMIIMKSIRSLIKAWEKILKPWMVFSTNTINGKELAMLVWNSISMEEREKDLEPTLNKISCTSHLPKKHPNFQCQNLIEGYWLPTQENYHLGQEIMSQSYRPLNQGYRMQHSLCQRHPEMCLSLNTELCTKT